jgi:hypothetical protein|tara:strand:- start:565 stop:714 length:150 start_codon:yes stop_codon:yes gene_type:complete
VLLYEILCGAAPFEYIVLDDESELDDCDDFDTASSVLITVEVPCVSICD